MEPRQILAALADLAPASRERIFDMLDAGHQFVMLSHPDRAPRTTDVNTLAGLDALHRDERLLRRGLAFVAGRTKLDGAQRRVWTPLLTQPVRLDRGPSGYRVVPAGDVEVTRLVEDRVLAAKLEAAPGLGEPGWLSAAGTAEWISEAAAAAGLPVAAVEPRPPRKDKDNHLVGVAVAGLFIVRDVTSTGLRETLVGWANRPGLEATALAEVYGVAEPAPRPSTSDDEILSPLPLNAAQREVILRARTEPVVVVSGPPGNGKSHAVIAAAIDTVDRGGSVLVATQSGYAADVLGDLLNRYPGPTPVLFGDAEHRDATAAELGRGAPAGADGAHLAADAQAVARAVAEVSEIRAGI
ncbi:MAG TPA: AAA family ATPase, partial [Micromonosporaceae bacterium]|nr:AAA family ATPase [Micromonosporaceae bacterium]